MPEPNPPAAPDTWRFLTNHSYVLVAIAHNPNARIRDVATHVGITERAAQRIVTQLVAAGYLHAERVGRRNHYRISSRRPLRHDLGQSTAIGELLKLLGPDTRH